MAECLLVVPVYVSVAVVSSQPSGFTLFTKYLRVGHEQNAIALVGFAGNWFPTEPLQIINDAFVKQDDDENPVEVKPLDVPKPDKNDNSQLQKLRFMFFLTNLIESSFFSIILVSV